jgi:hypothetical protein
MIVLLDFETVLTVWYFLFFIFHFLNIHLYMFVYSFLTIFVPTLIMTFSGDLTRKMSLKPLDQIVCPVFLFSASD